MGYSSQRSGTGVPPATSTTASATATNVHMESRRDRRPGGRGGGGGYPSGENAGGGPHDAYPQPGVPASLGGGGQAFHGCCPGVGGKYGGGSGQPGWSPEAGSGLIESGGVISSSFTFFSPREPRVPAPL